MGSAEIPFLSFELECVMNPCSAILLSILKTLKLQFQNYKHQKTNDLAKIQAIQD